MVVPTGVVVCGRADGLDRPIGRFRFERLNRRITDDPPYQACSVQSAPTPVGVAPANPTTLLTRFVEEREEHYCFMHNVEMWGWGNWCRRFLRQLEGMAVNLQPLIYPFNTISSL